MTSGKAYAVEQRLNQWVATGFGPPLAAVKANATVRQSTTTLANDPDLTLPVEANATYLLLLHVRYASGSSQNIKFGWSIPGSGTVYRSPLQVSLSGADTVAGDYDITEVATAAGRGTTVRTTYGEIGIVETGAAGSLTLRWAQDTSGAFDTTVYGHSALYLWKVG